jgi:hypothetical protein
MENEEVFGVKTFQSASCPLGPGDRNDTGGGDVSKELLDPFVGGGSDPGKPRGGRGN